MAIRDVIDRHQKWVALAAVLVLLFAAGSMAAQFWPTSWRWGDGGAQRPRAQWFYELSTGDLRTVEFAPPRRGGEAQEPAPDLAGLARAHVFACGDCGDPAARFVGLVEPVDDDAGRRWGGWGGQRAIGMALYDQPGAAVRPGGPAGRPVRVAEPAVKPSFVALDTAAGKRLITKLRARCPHDRPITLCTPQQ